MFGPHRGALGKGGATKVLVAVLSDGRVVRNADLLLRERYNAVLVVETGLCVTKDRWALVPYTVTPVELEKLVRMRTLAARI